VRIGDQTTLGVCSGEFFGRLDRAAEFDSRAMGFGDRAAGFHLQPGRTERALVRTRLRNLFLISRIEADEGLLFDLLEMFDNQGAEHGMTREAGVRRRR